MSTASTCARPKPLGLGHAVLCAEKLVGDEPFAVMLADDLLDGEPPVLTQMIDVFNHYHSVGDRRRADRAARFAARMA